jgi:beta-glucosidase
MSREIIDNFVNYAKVCVSLFGKYTNNWITFNEPAVFCNHGYVHGVHAPGLKIKNAQYICAHNVLLSHAYSAPVLRKILPGIHLGVALNNFWAEPFSDSLVDHLASERVLQFDLGWFANPLMFGQYHLEMLKRLPRSILPRFTKNESNLLKRSVDFLGLNHYTSRYVQHTGTTSKDDVLGVRFLVERNGELIGERAESDWLYVVPYGIRKTLEWMSKRFKDIPIMVT